MKKQVTLNAIAKNAKKLTKSEKKKVKGGIGGNNLSGLGMEVGQVIIVEDVVFN